MNVDEIRKYLSRFPDATENLQWGDDLCFKIRGKIFAIVASTVPALLQMHAGNVRRTDRTGGHHPAPYVGRYKWVMLDRLDALRNAELQGLIRQSYRDGGGEGPESRRLGFARARRLPGRKSARDPKKTEEDGSSSAEWLLGARSRFDSARLRSASLKSLRHHQGSPNQACDLRIKS